MAEEIIMLKGKRNVFRRALANLENDLDAVLSVFSVTSEKSIIDLKGIHDCYQNKIDELLKLDEKILSLIKEQKDVEAELEETLDKNDKLYRTISKIEHFLQKKPDEKDIFTVESPRTESLPLAEVTT